jgi:hypothetical protein
MELPKNSPIKKEFYDQLKKDKIEINWNKNPIEMKLFLSFLTVEVTRSTDHLGSSTGWTLLENKDLKLRISGGGVGGVEYLDSLQYGEKLSNPYNNYVNPFYLFEILTDKGKGFFVEYYKTEIDKAVRDAELIVSSLENRLVRQKEFLSQVKSEVEALREYSNPLADASHPGKGGGE